MPGKGPVKTSSELRMKEPPKAGGGELTRRLEWTQAMRARGSVNSNVGVQPSGCLLTSPAIRRRASAPTKRSLSLAESVGARAKDEPVVAGCGGAHGFWIGWRPDEAELRGRALASRSLGTRGNWPARFVATSTPGGIATPRPSASTRPTGGAARCTWSTSAPSSAAEFASLRGRMARPGVRGWLALRQESRGRLAKPRRWLRLRDVSPLVGHAMPGATCPARARPTIPARGVCGRQAARFRVFRPRRRGNVGAISAATFVSHPKAGEDGRGLPARRALARLGRDVLVNAPAAFPVRPADGGGAHADGSVSRDASWPFSAIPVADSPLTRHHPRSLCACPPFLVHFVHFVVLVRSRPILPDALAQFRAVFLKPSQAGRGSWAVR